MHSMFTDERYSMNEAARLLKVHVATIWRWYLHGVRGRKLSTKLIGARRYVLAEDLQTFLAALNDFKPVNADAVRCRAENAGRLLEARGIRMNDQLSSKSNP